jgi:hypothetical protein
LNRLIEIGEFRPLLPLLTRKSPDKQEVPLFESEVLPLEIGERSDEQACRDQQQQGDRYLQDNQTLAQADYSAAAGVVGSSSP